MIYIIFRFSCHSTNQPPPSSLALQAGGGFYFTAHQPPPPHPPRSQMRARGGGSLQTHAPIANPVPATNTRRVCFYFFTDTYIFFRFVHHYLTMQRQRDTMQVQYVIYFLTDFILPMDILFCIGSLL